MTILSPASRLATPAALIACLTLTLALIAPAPSAKATVFNVPPDAAPSSVDSGDILNLGDGGSIGDDFSANAGSVVNISGGTVGNSFNASRDSEVNISGGTVGDNFNAFRDSEVNISGGTFGAFFQANGDSEINISGGTFGSNFTATFGSMVNLFGTEFAIDGVVQDLTAGTPLPVTDRGVTLSGLFADGTAFSFGLNSNFAIGEDFFQSGAGVTLNLIPEPASALLLTAAAPLLVRRRRSAR